MPGETVIDDVRDRAEPFLMRVSGSRRPFLELRGARDGALCYLPRGEITGVRIVDDETIEFTDVGAVR